MQKRIVLLHGWGASTEKLKPLASALIIRGWEVLLPELPGFDIAAPVSPWYLKDYAQYVNSYAQENWGNGRYLVFGHSFGGRVGIKLSLISSQIAGLVLCASGGLSRGNFVKRSLFIVLAKTGKVFLFFPVIGKIFKKVLYKAAGEHDYEKAGGTMKTTMKNVIRENLRKAVSNIAIPLLVLWGTADKMTPIGDAHYIKKVHDNADLITYAQEGHRLPYNKPNKLARDIDLWYKSLH